MGFMESVVYAMTVEGIEGINVDEIETTYDNEPYLAIIRLLTHRLDVAKRTIAIQKDKSRITRRIIWYLHHDSDYLNEEEMEIMRDIINKSPSRQGRNAL